MRLSSKIGIFLMIISIIVFITPASPVKGTQEYEITGLSCLVYPDGSAKIEYRIDVDPVAARLNINLLGMEYDDLAAIDNEGLLLDYTLDKDTMTIDSLGSYLINISYFTTNLTNKTGSLWAMRITSPSEINVRLPVGATIVGLNPVPEGISIKNNQAFLELSQGAFSMTYVVSLTGIQKEAQSLIDSAQDLINQAKNNQIVVQDSETLFDKAITSFSLGNYIEAKTYAVQSQARTEETVILAGLAEIKINEAESKLASMDSGSDIYRDSEALIHAAKASYSSGNYSESFNLANQATVVSDSYVPPNNSYVYLPFLVIVPAIGYVVFRPQRKEPTREAAPDTYDIERIFEENQHLRQDEREIIIFIGEHSKGLFVSRIRERFELPKSTTWRMMQRFEKADIIKTSSRGQGTFVKINQIWAFSG
jgi:uncharacterized membrane protein